MSVIMSAIHSFRSDVKDDAERMTNIESFFKAWKCPVREVSLVYTSTYYMGGR